VGSGSQDRSETERTFLQGRVALLGAVLAVVNAIGVALSAIEGASVGTPALWYVIGTAVAALWAGLWLACRGRPRTPAFCRAAQATCLVANGVALGAMFRLLGGDSPVPGMDIFAWGDEPAGQFLGYFRLHWSLAHLYALALWCVLRAALVPSRPVRTLVVTLLAGLPLALFAGLPSLPLDPPVVVAATVPARFGSQGAVNALMQWGFTVVICTVVSAVIYGLRRELRQARRLGQYTLEAKLGEGGMGVVYRSSHAMMRRPTALKLLSATEASGDQIARFEREVQETAGLTHPNTITIFDYGRTPEGVFYYVMELLDGATAKAVVDATGPMPPERVAHMLRGVCGSLEEAHGVGLIHRDVKPANIHLCAQGGRHDVPKLLDFGLVKEVGGADAGLTVAGTIAGTPLYMAPEMISRPEAVDARADLYAVGAVGYFLLTGRHVFEGRSVVEICGHHLHSEPVSPSDRLGAPLPADLEALVLECLRKDPDERPQSAAAVTRRLDGVPPWTAHEAREWWEEYGHLFPAATAADGPSRSLAMAVDLTRQGSSKLR